MNTNENDRLNDLLVDRATEGLSAGHERELQKLLWKQPGINETDFEIAAAAVQLARPMSVEMLPDKLRNKVLADAERFFSIPTDAEAANVTVLPLSGETGRKLTPVASSPQSAVIPLPSRSRFQMAGWWAAAACLALAAFAWWQTTNRTPVIPAIEQQYAELRQTADVTKEWTATNYPGMQNVRGEVVWNTRAQRGFMRFEGLPKSDPAVAVYQLWIFDALRDERYPVDGGVFLNERDGVLIVPINAALKVNRPVLFAITMEPPGGVVVSKRDKLILTAKVG